MYKITSVNKTPRCVGRIHKVVLPVSETTTYLSQKDNI